MGFSVNGYNSANRPDMSQIKARLENRLKAAGASDEEITQAQNTTSGMKSLAQKYGIQPSQQQNSASIWNNGNNNFNNSGGSIFS